MELYKKNIDFLGALTELVLAFDKGKLVLNVIGEKGAVIFESREDFPMVCIPPPSTSGIVWDLTNQNILSIEHFRRNEKLLCNLNKNLLRQLQPLMNSLIQD